MQHPDITAAERYGYPAWQMESVRDCREMRHEYIGQNSTELVAWILTNHSDIVDEWLAQSDYDEWLEEAYS